ncbi:MAG TPA: pyruvate ferredoxin oxidoreductase [Planctomycetota bacterium]|nr:pyruvate ferredoxin oxidoreductase [Planctomycetota bacterium]HRR81329.1 pyruvate ferredoxin oxidoreductase [Planctomycetota bacterium]HRT95589.1 pyruvate ferredoxin oxidoreductase [Planctomycetota bacterium]
MATIAEQTRVSLTGNDAAAEALRQANPDVVPAYPITPQTELMHKFADFHANGLVDSEMVLVESEHSAMSAAIGASAAGARVATATSSQGYALMVEVCYIAAAYRLPIVMPLVNRALSGPINIHCDHSDAMLARDTGWIQLWSENSQEAYDNTLMAFRIAEHPDVLTPTIVNLDGFIISHTGEVVDILKDEPARAFVGSYQPARSLLDTEHPYSVGALFLPDNYYEARRQQQAAIEGALPVIEAVSREYGALSGRSYGILEGYRLDDAELVLVGLGSTIGTSKVAVDALRETGVKAGLLKIRLYRPFPGPQIIQAIRHAKAVGVLDRAISYGLNGGPLFHEVRSAAYGRMTAPFASYVYGLGGRDIIADEIVGIFRDLEAVSKGADAAQARYIGVRE